MTREELRVRELAWKTRLDSGELKFPDGAFDELATALARAERPGPDAGEFMDPVTFAPLTQAEFLHAVDPT